MPVEDIYEEKLILEDWQEIKKFLKDCKVDDFITLLGFEWQGSGLDGDHNVFYKNDGDFINPDRYSQLCELLPTDAIAIPHH